MWQQINCYRLRRKMGRLRSGRLIRALAVGCLVILAMGLLAGCGSAQGSARQRIVITEMDYWTGPPTDAEVTKLFDEYERTHPGVIIERDAVPFNSLLSKAIQEAASHTLPDLLMLDNPDVATFANAGVLLPLTSFMKGTYRAADFYAGPLSTMEFKGKIYAFSVGNNDLALFYNKKMFASAHLTPPTTWSQLYTDAKKLTHGNTYGFAFSAPADETATWQYEPFLWSNGGHLTNVTSPQAVAALQVLTKLVHDGYASSAVLDWEQNNTEIEFAAGYAAMMENGPWNLPLLDQAHFDYGVVPFPVPHAGMKPIVPLGGEDWTIPITTPSQERATWNLINWLEQPPQLLEFDKTIGYIPAIKSTAQTLLKSQPAMSVFADEFNTARARTAHTGADYPSISEAIWTAIQSALSGSASPQTALAQAQGRISTILHSGG
jgi:multiple sugar transport system substrate-binding protein